MVGAVAKPTGLAELPEMVSKEGRRVSVSVEREEVPFGFQCFLSSGIDLSSPSEGRPLSEKDDWP